MLRRTLLMLVAMVLATGAARAAERPNILWFIVEDASPHIGCYGETTIRTPHIDQLAADGVRFENAFITAPVCSPSRSAIVAGMYQTSFGSHNHRSANEDVKAGGNAAYYDSYRTPEGIRLVPELFADAGYYVINGGKAKTDYNFISRTELYRGKDWSGRASGQPFFAQIQLAGGKNRRAKVAQPTDPATVKLPPYYPDDPQMREDWAEYLNSWVACDEQVGDVLADLERDGLADSTIVFFLTDHGISHLRGKQFLYDEGMRVPLIVRFPDGRAAGTTRADLVSHIDVAAASLDLAGIAIPDNIQGRPLFSAAHEPRTEVYAARDRCDETVDFLRAVRNERFKYIRNFLSDVSHSQPNRYKDGKKIMQTARKLHAAGQLDELQSRIFAPTRPTEELYDLAADPWETNNLAGKPEYDAVLREMREKLYAWMDETRDAGVIPEPILEELGAKYGSKYAALRRDENQDLVREVIATIAAGDERDVPALRSALQSPQPPVRYWAARKLGLLGDASGGSENSANSSQASAALDEAARELAPLLNDEFGGVRVAAAEAIVRLSGDQRGIDVLATELSNDNLVAGFYAIRSIEALGDRTAVLMPKIKTLTKAPYDSTRRIAERLVQTAR